MKMFINKTNIKLLAAALLTALATPSCMNLDETREGGYGYLTISGLDLDVQVEQLVPTKAEPVTLKSLGIDAAPDLSKILFTLERHNSNPGTKSSEEDTVQPNVELPLEAGTYTLRVKYNGNNGADGFGEALFKEDMSYPVTITTGERTQLEISLPLINSLIAVSVKDDLREDFSPSSISISYDDQEVQVEENVYHFVPAASDVTVTVTGTTAGVSNELKHDFTTPAAAKYADVKFGKSTTEIPSITMGDVSEGAFAGGLYFSPAELTNISSNHNVVYKYQLEGDSDWTTATEISEVNGYKYLSGLTDGKKYFIKACVGNIESEPVGFSPVSFENCVTIAAAAGYPQHYTENNELAGTKMHASVKVELPPIVAQLAVLSVESVIFKKGTDTRGTFNVTAENKKLTNDTAKPIEISNSTDWPYFPKGGDYVLDATIKCLLPNNRTIISEPVSSTEITSPAPSFNVTVSAETSYSRYLNYKNGVSGYTLALANTKDSGDDIMNIRAKVGISDNILSKSHYKELLSDASLKYDTNTVLTNTSNTVGTLTAANLDGQSWQKHTVSASFKFDGVEKAGSIDCHVTGLPYSIDFTQGADGWTLNDNCSQSDSGLNFDPTATPYAKMDFAYMPNTVDVSLFLYKGVKLNATSTISRAHLNVKIGDKDNEQVLRAESVVLGNKTTTTSDETKVEGSFSSSSKSVQLKTNALVAGMWVIVPGLRIDYR